MENFKEVNVFDRATLAKKHTQAMYEKYGDEIDTCAGLSVIYPDSLNTFRVTPVMESMDICLKPLDSVSAIFASEISHHCCVLNFADYLSPGGAFLSGSRAQEECLCHESYLYNVLSRKILDFYNTHTDLNQSLYRNDLIYSPNVKFFHENNTRNCDVITCAAPYRKDAKMNGICDDEINNAMKERIDHILYVAYLNNVETLILGAFGCGIFGNDADTVAHIFKEVIHKKYNNAFKKIVFAVPDFDERNLMSFLMTFGSK